MDSLSDLGEAPRPSQRCLGSAVDSRVAGRDAPDTVKGAPHAPTDQHSRSVRPAPGGGVSLYGASVDQVERGDPGSPPRSTADGSSCAWMRIRGAAQSPVGVHRQGPGEALEGRVRATVRSSARLMTSEPSTSTSEPSSIARSSSVAAS
jgi:hypothetical protein